MDVKIQKALFLNPKEIEDSKQGLIQFARFVVAGGISAAIELGTLYLLVKILGMHYLYANAIAFIFANIFNYVVSRLWVYGSGKYFIGVEILGFMIAGTVGLFINQLILLILYQKIKLPLLVAKVGAIIMTILWNFFSKKHIVFKS